MLTLKEFKEARSVLSGVIRDTSLLYSPAFSKATGNHVYIKPENMQITGRGVRHHRYAHHHPPGEGKQHQGLRRQGGASRGDL